MNNPNVKIREAKVLSNNWYTLKKIIFDYKNSRGEWVNLSRESYDRGNGAAILIYHPQKNTVILTRQFRMPTYINGNDSGMLIEVCAGVLDEDSPEDCAKREAQEETGYTVKNVKKVFESYMSPGAVTEILHLFIGEYSDEARHHDGGGLTSEHEDIETLELPFKQALEMIKSGEIKDGKTIMLLQYAALNQIMAY